MGLTEQYTHDEVDQLVGSMLYLGRVHNVIATLLDTTRYRSDLALIEFVNHAPVELVEELLPATAMLLAEVHARVVELERAVAAAMDSTAARVVADADLAASDTEFDRMMTAEFAKDRKRNGG